MEPRNKKTHSRFKLPTLITGVVALLVFMIALYFITSQQTVEPINLAAITDSVRNNRSTVIAGVEAYNSIVENNLNNNDSPPTIGDIPVGTELSFPDKEYMVFNIPDLSRVDIGGLWKTGDPCSGTDGDKSSMINVYEWMETYMPDVKNNKLGWSKPFTLFGAMYRWTSNKTFRPTIINSYNHRSVTHYGADILNSRFVAAFGSYFSSKDKPWAKFGQQNNGGCYDLVLKDGTVIPFVRLDNKSDSHTNNKHNTFVPLKLPEYEHIFQSVGMEMFEIWGENRKGQDSIDVTIRTTYGITEDNPIVSMVLYNVYVDQLDAYGNFESEERRHD